MNSCTHIWNKIDVKKDYRERSNLTSERIVALTLVCEVCKAVRTDRLETVIEYPKVADRSD